MVSQKLQYINPTITDLVFFWMKISRMSEKRNCMPENRFCMPKKFFACLNLKKHNPK
jgi:hypothetical protein